MVIQSWRCVGTQVTIVMLALRSLLHKEVLMEPVRRSNYRIFLCKPSVKLKGGNIKIMQLGSDT